MVRKPKPTRIPDGQEAFDEDESEGYTPMSEEERRKFLAEREERAEESHRDFENRMEAQRDQRTHLRSGVPVDLLVSVPGNLAKRIEAEAKESGKTISDFVLTLLLDHFAEPSLDEMLASLMSRHRPH